MNDGERTVVQVVLDRQLHMTAELANGYPRFTIETGGATVVLITEAEEQGRPVDKDDLRIAHAIADSFGGFTHSVVRAIGSAQI